jgi:hypothetical protein
MRYMLPICISSSLFLLQFLSTFMTSTLNAYASVHSRHHRRTMGNAQTRLISRSHYYSKRLKNNTETITKSDDKT